MDRDDCVLISLKGIKKRYGSTGGVEALRGIDLTIRRGEYVAITGPSGSGKSTLMNILGCLDNPTCGRYLLNGVEVSGMGEEELARVRNRDIGFVFQSFNLLPNYTALSNVALPLFYAGVPERERLERAFAVLERVGLASRAHHRPAEMSGGERQRVAVARALINRPSLILADEPTGNLDTTRSDEIVSLFGEIREEGNTVVIVTHNAEVAQCAARVLFISDGLVAGDMQFF